MQRKLKIAIFTDSFYPQINGVATSVAMISRWLSKNNHNVIIFAPKYKIKNEFNEKKVIIKRVFGISGKFYEGFKISMPFDPRIINNIISFKPDIIHFHTPITLGFQAIMISKLLRIPLVGTFHTFIADEEYLKHIKVKNKLMQKAAWNYSNFYYNQCDIITCPSICAKKELLQNNCKKKTIVISNGIDKTIFDNKNYKKIKNKYNKNGPLLLYVGRIAHEKNINFLIDAFKLISDKIKDAKLLIVGDGPQLLDIKNKIKKLNLDEKIILLGKIPHNKLVKSGIYKACDLFVSASSTETQGLTFLEAQINGLVCIGINSRGVCELIQNNINGFLIEKNDILDFKNKIIKLLKDKELMKKMKKETLKQIKKHDMELVIKKWEDVYYGLVKKK
jgi:1,2-diacylglycerol 3-alpha-glucosyltransferase